MTSPPVVSRVEDGIAHVVLDRPQSANAIDVPLTAALRHELLAADADPDVRAIVLSGNGKHFCVGGDVAAMAATEDREAFLRELAGAAHEAVRAMHANRKPIVAAVHGASAGAGLALALSADAVVAAESASFVTAYAAIGVTPDCGLSWLLPRIVGYSRALELLVTSERFSAADAKAWGMVTEVVDTDPVRAAHELASRLGRGAPGIVTEMRRLLLDAQTQGLDAHLDQEASTIAAMSTTEAADRLITAFAAR